MAEDVPISVNEGSVLLADEKLIILKEALLYCENNYTDRIRYSKLKNLSNEALCSLTEEKLFQRTGFGGQFENLIRILESPLNPKERYLTRLRESRRRTLILPKMQKIRNLLERKHLIDKIGEFDNFPSTHRKEYASAYQGIYIINRPELCNGQRIYSDNRWEISEAYTHKKIKLPVGVKYKLLEAGKQIASTKQDPFRIVIEYKGPPSLIIKKEHLETFIN